MNQITLDRALVDDVIALLKAIEATEPASVRAIAVNVTQRYLPKRAYLLRETMRIRQNLEDHLSDAALARPVPGLLSGVG